MNDVEYHKGQALWWLEQNVNTVENPAEAASRAVAHASLAMLAMLEALTTPPSALPEQQEPRYGAVEFDEDTAIMVCGHMGRHWSSEWRRCMACMTAHPRAPTPEVQHPTEGEG